MNKQNSVTTLTIESIEEHQKWLRGLGLSSSTLRAYSSDLRMLLLEMDQTSISCQDLQDEAAKWLNTYRNTKASKTILRRISAVRSFAEWVGADGVLAHYKAPVPKRATAHPLPEGITDVRSMLDACGDREDLRSLVVLCGLCGLRVGEALAVTSENYISDRQLLCIRGKGDKEREVPLSTEALAILGPRFASVRRGESIIGLGDRSARRALTRLGWDSLNRPIASHDLRMTFGTEVNDRHGLRVAQELLGHASSRSTEIYTRVTLEQRRAAVEF